MNLVEFLPAGWKRSESSPSVFPPYELLLWFVPLSFASASMPFLLLLKLSPSRFHPLHIMAILVGLVVPIGGLWMFVQVIDHEERAKDWVLLSFIPFMFLWYRFVRYPVRPQFVPYPRRNPGRPA